MSPATDARARQLRRYAEHMAGVADFRRRRESDVQDRAEALIAEVIHVLAGALLGEHAASTRCPSCRRALGTRCRKCPHGCVPAEGSADDRAA